ncbi:MAG: hypothetical protein GX222_04825 [Ruminococcaceae bacterium]|nr:hypothetical protein [Oscillospiraceae bacterium]
MMRKMVIFCLTALMIMSIFSNLKGCVAGKLDDYSAWEGGESADDVKDVMNDVFGKSELSEEDKEAANEMFDFFTKPKS